MTGLKYQEKTIGGIRLSSAATKAKAKWNSANYAQIKVQVRPEVAVSFKAACASAGISMAGELSRFMAEYGAAAPSQKTGNKIEEAYSVSTKKKRSKAVRLLIDKLGQVRDAEEQAMENTPENFRGSESFEASEERVSSIDEALEILEGLY